MPEPAKSTTSFSELECSDAALLLSSGGAILIDVRNPDEHAASRISGSLLMPLPSLEARAVFALARKGRGVGDSSASESPTRVVVHCRSGVRSATACAQLTAAGASDCIFINLKGGILAWTAAGLPTSSAPAAPLGE
ncbi:MAG: rhodanese-like domain-containing protein [Phycisphaerales bacterium]|nr:rhodanese-like domain-containing protein [Phycisphaerales bacterium]